MLTPKISIITPSYNQARYLEQTIKSVVDQNYPRLEYLIMDGGSTDGSVQIIKKYAAKYPKIIRWRSHKDSGQVSAINEGLAKAKGDIVAYINSDDYYLPGSFQQVASYFQSHPDCMWLVGNCQVTQISLKWTFWLKHLWLVDKFPWALLIYNTINQPAVFLQRSLVKKVGMFDSKYKYAFDYDYWIRCLKYSMPFRLHTALAVFRVHSDSLGNRGYEVQFTEDIAVCKKYISNKFIIFLHSLGSKLTTTGYHLLKS